MICSYLTSIVMIVCVCVAECVRQSRGVVLVHCHAGISRSATICIAYLMYHKCLTLEQAYDYLKARRSLIAPNLNFMRQLLEYEGQLRDRGHFKSVASSAVADNNDEDNLLSVLAVGQKRHLPVTRGLSLSSSDPTDLRPCSKRMVSSMSLPLTPCTQQVNFVFDTSMASHTSSSPTINVCQSTLLSPS